MAEKKSNPLSLKYKKDAAEAEEPFVHKYVCCAVCETDSKGFATPNDRSLHELVVDASGGFIPLWKKNSTLRWRFQERSMVVFRKPDSAKQYMRELIAAGIMLWDNAPPVKFKEVEDNWDFEVVMRPEEKCSQNGCVLASAFFPDAGRHELVFYPTLFKQSRKEQVETLAHEIGHIFGLRHFFANITEKKWRSEIFGKHNPFSIMNYGDKSRMAESDKADLKTLYSLVWANELTKINGTTIKTVKPFSSASNTKIVLDLAAMLS